MIIFKDLVWEVDWYVRFDFSIVVDLRIVLVPADHHTLLSVLDQVGVIPAFFTKLLSANTNQASADCPVLAILNIYPVGALAIYALNF